MKLSKPPGVAQSRVWAIALLTLGKRELDSPTVQQTIGCINLAPRALERLKPEKPEEFEKLKADIPLILAEGKGAYLNLDKSWREIHFVLTGEDYSVHLPFLVGENDEEHLPSINAVRGGTEIEYDPGYGYVRYLTALEVKQVAEALSKFSHAQIRARLKSLGWKEDSVDYLFDYKCTPLVRYYQDAAYQGNAPNWRSCSLVAH